MSEIIEDDSDIEILDSGSLRSSYFRQQLKLIYDLEECRKPIPCRLPQFQEFVKENIKWNPNPQLVLSTWMKLKNAEKETASTKPPPVVEISDDEGYDDCTVVNDIQSSKHFRRKPPKLSTENKVKSQSPEANIDNPSSPEVIIIEDTSSSSSSGIEITDKEPPKNRRTSSRKKPPVDYNVDKRPKKRMREESPTMTDAEAEMLREQILIDKIIELELPKVLQSVMQGSALDTITSPDYVSSVIQKSRKKRRKLSESALLLGI